MARRLRIDRGDTVYHVLNRRVGKLQLFEKEQDYAAFEQVLAEAPERAPMRLLAYCLMPTHWHLVLFPRKDGDLSRYMQWLTTTHMRRWHQHHGTRGTGPLYQGRFKSFPMQRDDHFLTVCRYVERNPLRAKLTRTAEAWRWSSLALRSRPEEGAWLTTKENWPVRPPRDWFACVNRVQTAPEVEAIHASIQRGAPYGDEAWQKRTAARLQLESSLRPMGRPRREPEKLA
jgi:putative transposase